MIISITDIESRIFLIRGQKVMLDADLAELYGVETFNLNKAVKRNLDRFPADFMFQLTEEEADALRFQIGMSKASGRGGRRFHVSIDKGLIRKLEIPLWHLKLGQSTLRALCLYRKWRGRAFICAAQYKGRSGQYSDHEDPSES